MPFHNPARWGNPYAELYREQREQIVRAEELGYDNIWLTEHHFDEAGWSPALTGYQQTTRVTHMALGMHVPGVAPEKVLHSMELFAKEVMPALSS